MSSSSSVSVVSSSVLYTFSAQSASNVEEAAPSSSLSSSGSGSIESPTVVDGDVGNGNSVTVDGVLSGHSSKKYMDSMDMWTGGRSGPRCYKIWCVLRNGHLYFQ